MSDRILRFTAAAATLRGEYLELDRSWQDIIARHALPAPVRDCFGELIASALLLAATIKHDGSLVLQVHGDGPLKLAVVECRSDGSFRATLKLTDAPIGDAARFTDLVNRDGGGRCAVTLAGNSDASPHTGHAYQGIVPLDGDTVAAAIEQYMSRSEQIPTRLWLACDARRIRGLMLQRMPDAGGIAHGIGADPDAWPRFVKLAETLPAAEMLATAAEEILHRLFWQEQLAGIDARALRFACTCSREKVADMLRMLGRHEIDQVLAERGELEVHCEFCNAGWRFDPVDCAALFIDGLASASMTRQ